MKEKKKNNILSSENEKQIVQKELKTIFHDKWKYYKTCKEKYSEIYPIVWNETSIADLISLCNMFNQTFHEQFKKVPVETRFDLVIRTFELLIKNTPAFFKTFTPKTFLRFFNVIISQKQFLSKLELIISSDKIEGYF